MFSTLPWGSWPGFVRRYAHKARRSFLDFPSNKRAISWVAESFADSELVSGMESTSLAEPVEVAASSLALPRGFCWSTGDVIGPGGVVYVTPSGVSISA